ncbi:hypothetical protein [Melittangium boletus]|nr:hypothetical protein [Melittangium boletus]
MKCVLSDEEIRRSTSSEVDELLVGYHLFQTAVFLGTSVRADVFGDANAAAAGDFSKSLFVVPGVDFALAWSHVFSWLDSPEKKWVYDHPDDAARLVLEKTSPGRVRIYLDWKPKDFIEVDGNELLEASIEAVDGLVLNLVQHLPNCPAEDVADSLEELETSYAEPE